MNTPKSNDDVLRDLNDLAKAQGRYLGKAFWEIPRQPGSILEIPLTPEAEERIRRLDAKIARLKRQRAASQVPDGQEARTEVRDLTTAPPSAAPGGSEGDSGSDAEAIRNPV
jgi:hypothetical protein